MDDQRTKTLDEAMRRFGEAWARGDGAALETMVSPSYTHGDIYGRFQDRAGWLDYARGRAGQATRIGFRDMKTRIVGDVAIVTGINDVQALGEAASAGREDVSLRFTQVWIWRDGRWLREAFQATAMPNA